MKYLDQPPSDLQPFFAPQEFSADFSLHDGTYEVTISTPDLRALPVSVWGDWGPMYTCELDPAQLVTLVYSCPRTGRRAHYEISPPTIAVNSPMLAVERKRWPFALELDDMARGLRLIAYLDHEGRFDHLVAKAVGSGVDPARLLFRGQTRVRSRAPHSPAELGAHAR